MNESDKLKSLNEDNQSSSQSIYKPEEKKQINIMNIKHEHNEQNNIDKTLIDCVELKRLKKELYLYSNENTSTDDIHIGDVLNDFVYVMKEFCDSDHNFDYIYNYMQMSCNLNQCKIAKRRNVRNKVQKSIDKISEPTNHDHDKLIDDKQSSHEMVFEQIMDKIHCYFFHSYATAMRLTTNEKTIVDNIKSNHTAKIKKIRNILHNKRKTIDDPAILNQTRHSKYKQLMTHNEQDDEKCKLYSFGKRFKYKYDTNEGFHPIYDNFYRIDTTTDSMIVEPKYNTFKEELTTNKLSVLLMEQFDAEYLKAITYFNTHFCRKHYKPYFEKIDGDEVGDIQPHHILSMLIYCNYDTLQFEFSKTYRVNIDQHNEFYHFAKSLKESMANCRQNTHSLLDQVLGMNDTKSKKALFTQTLYHGISELLVFPMYMNCQPLCPLSTTISKEVATRFGSNQGMIIEFEADYGKPRRLSVSWLSDFVSEKEQLFVQSGGPGESLKMRNIIRVRDSCEFKLILNALLIMKEIHVLNKAKKWINIQNETQLVIEALIEHQLHYKFPNKYKAFDSLDAYGANMLNRFCENQTFMVFDMKYYNNKYLFLRKILFDGSHDWINMGVINALFPNLKEIMLCNANLCSFILKDVMNNYQLVHFTNITISALPQSELTISDALEQYKDIFLNDFNINMKISDGISGGEYIALQW
eukprot:461068_1